MTAENKPIVEVFSLFAQWYNKNFNTNLKQLGKVFTYEFKTFTNKKSGTHTWKIAVNGQETEQNDPIGNCGILPIHMHVYRNNWLVAICSPFEGTGIHGLDNQFIDLLKNLLKRKRKEVLEAE